MPLSFVLNLGASTDGSVDDLSQTKSCSHARTYEFTQVHTFRMLYAQGYKIFKERGEINGAEAHGYGFRTEAKMWFQLQEDLWFNFNVILSIR